MTATVSDNVDEKRRRLLLVATAVAGAAAGAGVAVPFLASWAPSARALAAGAPVEFDISKVEPGQQITVEWRGKPVWILRRTKEQIEALPKHDDELADPQSERTAYPIPSYAKNEDRSIKPEYLVVIGICTHLGCSPGDKFTPGPQPSLPDDWAGGFLCPCHGSTFDLAGRVFKNKPAPDNLEVPPHMYLSDSMLVIGEDKQA
jgi:ubiquinol-cytochrome c reductase iron-sulfur subunit